MALPINRMSGCEQAWHLYPVLIDFENTGKTRAEVMSELREQGIGIQVYYIPVHHQTYYANRYGPEKLRGAGAYYERGVSLPPSVCLTNDDIKHVVNTLMHPIAQRT
jgi:dTDP-4-amino-4,6-dideoxygalactose transaminase